MTKIHLAEDDQTMVTLLKTLLKLEGYEAIAVDLANGSLLSTLKKDVPELLLLDVNLPSENGLDIMRAMRADALFDNTRVIMASGLSVRIECLESGANDFLQKPYMPDDLINLIKKHVS